MYSIVGCVLEKNICQSITGFLIYTLIIVYPSWYRKFRFSSSVWKLAQNRNVDVDVAIVLVVSFQPLECTLDYNPPDSEVTVRIVGTFLPQIITSSSEGNLGRLVANTDRS